MSGTSPRLSGPPEAVQKICSPADPTVLGLPGLGMQGGGGDWAQRIMAQEILESGSGTPESQPSLRGDFKVWKLCPFLPQPVSHFHFPSQARLDFGPSSQLLMS